MYYISRAIYINEKIGLALFSDSACEDRMDQIFLSYPQANGVPQESKLATYMVCISFFILYYTTY